MRLLRDWRNVPPEYKGGVIALGNFDGLHRGHLAVIRAMQSEAARRGARSAVMSFEPHPRRFFQPGRGPIRLFPFHYKARLLRHYGVELLAALRFTRAFSQLTAQQFIDEVLIKGLSVSHVVTGQDFIFGHQRQGNSELLETISRETGAFGFTRIAPVGGRELIFSSTLVRTYVQSGEMEKAAEILGRPYEMTGRVVQGDQRGRTIGFPTANMIPGPILLPRFGVYAVRASLAPEPFQLEEETNWIDGVANLGLRPTFVDTQPLLEVHLFDTEKELYGKRLRVEYVAHLRDEKKFEGVDALREQITRDSQKARAVLKR